MSYKKYQRFNNTRAFLTLNDGSVTTVVGTKAEVDEFEREVIPQCHTILGSGAAHNERPLPLPDSFMTDEDRQALAEVEEQEVGQLSAGRVEQLVTHGETPLPLPSTMPQAARPAVQANERAQRADRVSHGETPMPATDAAWERAFRE